MNYQHAFSHSGSLPTGEGGGRGRLYFSYGINILLHHRPWCRSNDACHLHHTRSVHRHQVLKSPEERTLRRCRLRRTRSHHRTADLQSRTCTRTGSGYLQSEARCLRHGMACCRICGIQHHRGRIHHPRMPRRQPPTPVHRFHTHGQHRPMELLALRLHRSRDLFPNRQHHVGLLRRHHLLYHHPRTCRYDGKEIPEVLPRHGRNIHPTAFLSGFHAYRHRHR